MVARTTDSSTVQIRVLEIGRSSHRFLKHLVKFRNWGAEVALDFYRAISKTRVAARPPLGPRGRLRDACLVPRPVHA